MGNVFATDVGVSPNGATVVFTAGFNPAIHIYDTATNSLTQTFTQEVNNTFTGIVFNAAGDRFWVSGGGDHSILEFDLIGGVASFVRRIPLAGFPAGLVLSNNENFLYTSLHMNKRMIKVRISDGAEMASYPCHLYPYDLAVTSDETMAFVPSLGGGVVSVFDLTDQTLLAEIPVGYHPEGVALSPDDTRLYVANTGSDSISVIDTQNLVEIDQWELHDDNVMSMGAMPLSIEISSDGSKLYVTCAGYDSVDVIDTTNGEILGRIPTGWYPINAALDPTNNRLMIANAKGVGSAGTLHAVRWPSALQILDMPTPAELVEYTDEVQACTRWSSQFYDDWSAEKFESPIPNEWGVRSDKIRHVVFILRENKTFDQLLADLPNVEADPQYLIFGREIIPNTHEIAETFTNCDNFYVEGDTSVIGHLWATFANCTDHAEKAFLAGGKYPLPDMDPGTRPEAGPIFKRILDAGLEFRSYGQIIRLANDLDRFGPYMDLHYGFWNMGTSDENEKAEEIIREWEKGMFPDFIYIVLPNDHNYGSSSGAPTPNWLMSDNDAGMGKLVDWISHSKYWEETAIFMTMDDPQSGWDHIDPHRTLALVASPWAKRGHVSSVLYNMSSMWLTIELILGLPPSSKFDQYAAPMYDCFTMNKDTTPYIYTPNSNPIEINPDGLPYQDYCDKGNFLAPDSVPGLARVLWAMYKPGQPFPDQLSVDAGIGEEEDDDEDEGAEYYMEQVNKARAWGKKRGIDVPVPDGFDAMFEKIEKEDKD